MILVSLALQLAGEAISMQGDSRPATVTLVAPSDSTPEPCDVGVRFPADVLVAMTMDELRYLQSTLCPNQ